MNHLKPKEHLLLPSIDFGGATKKNTETNVTELMAELQNTFILYRKIMCNSKNMNFLIMKPHKIKCERVTTEHNMAYPKLQLLRIKNMAVSKEKSDGIQVN